MGKFTLPMKLFIVKNAGELTTMYNEHEDVIAIDLQGRHPDWFGFDTVAEIKVKYSEDQSFPGTQESWISSLQERALDAYKQGKTEITV